MESGVNLPPIPGSVQPPRKRFFHSTPLCRLAAAITSTTFARATATPWSGFPAPELLVFWTEPSAARAWLSP